MKFIPTLLVIFLSIPLFIMNGQKSSLGNYNLRGEEQYELNYVLNEVSGLAFSSDKLFAHNDESAAIFQLNPKSGKIIKKFTVGNPAVAGDFEGLAIANNKFYLVTSTGTIYMFSEAKDGGNAGYKKFSTGIDKANIEGLCFDESTNSLLIACKGNGGNSKGKKAKDLRFIYSFDLGTKRAAGSARFTIDIDELKSKYDINNFSPSGIEKNPRSGSFFIISSKDKAIVEFTEDGEIVDAVKLDEYKHNQPEGITFAPDGTLIITDEGGKGKATITRYFLKK